EVINLAWQQVSDRFGVPTSCLDGFKEKGFGVIAYGKTGGVELGYSSDLDLVFVHHSQPDEVTTGSKSVPASQFYMKLAQRIMHIFNTRMNSGILYELDMRLRPSGNSGLLVVHLTTFAQYQHEDAWTWEHQALVRARMIFGNDELRQQFVNVRQDVLSQAREFGELKNDIITMREKMRSHLDKSTESIFDIKQGTGGLVDIEFLAQFLVLAHANQHNDLMLYCDNLGIFKRLLKLGLLEKVEQQQLSNMYQKLRALGHQATMQNAGQLIDREKVVGQSAISNIWIKYLIDD
ncbi:MAG: glutamate-ammonia-ligase adenylyltransferase, partial [Colwellia sp.]